MYHNTILQRPLKEEEDHARKMAGEHVAYGGPHSPTQAQYNYSPTARSHHSSTPTPAPLSMHRTSASSTGNAPNSPSSRGLPPISSTLYQRDNPPPISKYYDPTTDHGDASAVRHSGRYDNQYPPQPREPYNYAEVRPSDNHRDGGFHSPVTASFPRQSPILNQPAPAQPQPRMEAISQSPTAQSAYQGISSAQQPLSTSNHSRGPSADVGNHAHQAAAQEPPPQTTPSRTADPMSLSSIMSDTDTKPAIPNRFSAPAPQQQAVSQPKPLAPPPLKVEEEASVPKLVQEAPRHRNVSSKTNQNKEATNGVHSTPLQPISANIDERMIEAELAKIENMELSDVEGPGFENEREEYRQRGLKRSWALDATETIKRKRRRTAEIKRYQEVFAYHADAAKIDFDREHKNSAWQEVQNQEIAEEKERKKDMQRKRRREKTLQNEYQKRKEAIEKAQNALNGEEREKFFREAQKAEKKVKATNQLLQGGTPSKDIREVTPLAPNLEGGTMTTFQMTDDLPRDTTKKKGRTGTRPRKSKEQKQAEKDAAAAAQAAIERGDELPTIAPKEEARVEGTKRERGHKDEDPPPVTSQYDSKVYKNLYESIWKDISKKDLPKVIRVKDNSFATKQSNLRKTAQLASKEARRWQMRTNKSMKDVQARAKRSMREMLSFWKRNERDERDQRKLAERQELENAKKAEAEREANRQKRKLNFLISQTELYSHFIGKKVKTDEVERSTDDVAASGEKIAPGDANAHTIDLPESVGNLGTKVTNFEDLDFDAEDETVLRQAAMANAQNAVKEAQDRARAFNNEGQNIQSDFDDGEMNFQNPTSLQNMDVAQPKMLTCQLKEYQLKGLNWLVNLYEQGINGILADEMGLGKTVQSISVMAYLSEVHNIWGPFLVIAPASTLHNWQQEIARFVPDMQVLPYWGNAKDRKILRKFWDRKHITYNKDSPFHVLVTSYQLVVMDAQYFQKIRWQYMILDEAQAIKSSQSSRWKSLLGFHCRNRLLLTGTPIQNNMQELWALLHFIMPSLFDSHDEFSDWFSKDIESHAQSNTKLNEDQLKRLHMILKPFMLRRIKKHVQKELGDKIELDVFCDLTYRQRAYYSNLRNKISIMDLIEKVVGDDQDTATLMNLVMQFRKVCNHPDLFERADTTSPLAFSYFAETASFLREGQNVDVGYSVRSLIEIPMPRLVYDGSGRLHRPGPENSRVGWTNKYLNHMMNIWSPDNIVQSTEKSGAFTWLRFADQSPGQVSAAAKREIFERAIALSASENSRARLPVVYDGGETPEHNPAHALFNIVDSGKRRALAEVTTEGYMQNLLNVSKNTFDDTGFGVIELGAKPAVSAPPVELYCNSQNAVMERQRELFNTNVRQALYDPSEKTENAVLDYKIEPSALPPSGLLPAPSSLKSRYTHIQVPSMRRFVTDSGKLAKLDQLLKKLKEEGHRILLYFQMTRMIDLMEEYLTYRNYKYCRLDGSTKLEDRRDTVADFQTRPEIFVFLLSTRAGGLGINLTSADTVIFYDSDWNPTIDSQAMDRAHRLGQTKQVTVYRMITRGTIEERIRKRALQKEEVQRVVISGGAGAGVDFNTRSRENRTKDIAMWLADDDQAAEIEKKEAEMAAAEANAPPGKKRRAPRKKADMSLDEMYHEGEGHFDDGSTKPSGAATPVSAFEGGGAAGAAAAAAGKGGKRKGGGSKKAKTLKQRLAIADAEGDLGMS